MIIENLENLTFEVTDDDELGFITVVITDPSIPVIVGTLRIAKTRAEAFLDSLKIVCREIHSTFEVNDKATTKFDNKTSGTLEFRDA